MKTGRFSAPQIAHPRGAKEGALAGLIRYGKALCVVLLAAAVLLIPALRDASGTPSFVLLLAVMLSAWSGGFGPGMFATILIALGTLPSDLPPWRQLRLALFLAVGTLICALVQSLRNSQRRAVAHADSLGAILNASADLIYVMDLEGRYLHISHNAARLMDLTPEEFVGRTWVELGFPAEIMEPFDAIRASVLSSGKPWRGELPLGDSAVPGQFEYIIAPVDDQHGATPNKVVVVARDVSDRDRADKADHRLAAIVDSSDDAIIGKDLDGTVTSWNKGAERLFGYTTEEMVGSPIDRLIPPDRKAEEPKILEQLRRGERVDHFESIRVAKDGRMIDISLMISPIRDSTGRVIGASKVGRDITERKMDERAIRERDDRIRAIVENVIDGLVTIDERGAIVTVNPAVRRLFGYGDEELIGSNVRMLMPEPYHSEHDAYLSSYRQTGVRKIIGLGREVVGLRKDGSTFPLDLSVSEFESGGSRYFAGILRDITERRRAEETIREHARLLNQALDPIIAWVLGGTITYWNEAAHGLYGFTAEEAIGRVSHDLLETVFPDGIEAFEEALRENGGWDGKLRHRTKNGGWVTVDSRITVVTRPGRDALSLETDRDITERKRSEEVQARLAAIVDSSDDSVMSEDLDGIIVTWNASAERIFGYMSDEVIGRPTDTILISPSKPGEARILLDAAKRGGVVRNFETSRLRKDGSIVELSVTISMIRDRAGDVVGVARIHRDITDRLRIEAAVREFERLARSVLDSLPDQIVVLGESGTIEMSNRAWEAFAEENGAVSPVGVGANYLQACESSTESDRADATTFASAIRDMLAGELDTFELEYPCHMPTESRWFIGRLTPFQGEGPRRLVVSHQDITVRKAGEAMLRDRERMLAQSQRMAHVGSWELVLEDISDASRSTLRWSDECYRIFGYEPGCVTVSNDLFFQALTEADRDAISSAIAISIRENQPYKIKHQIMRPDGTTRIVQEWGEIVTDARSAITRIFGTCQDITERKRAEAAVRESEARLSLFVEHAPVAIAMFDAQMCYLATSRRWLTDYGLNGQDLRGRCHYEVFPSMPEPWREIHRRGLQGAIERNEDDRVEWAEGRTQWLRWEVRPWYADSGAVAGIIIFTEDITQRKQAEEALRISEERLALATQAAGLGTWDVDLASQTCAWSPIQAVLFGFPPGTLETTAAEVTDHVHPDDRSELERALAHASETRGLYQLDFRVNLPDGSVRWVANLGRFRYNQAGLATRIVGISQDVTERKLAEQALREADRKVVAILESITDGVLTFDREWRYQYLNPQAERILGRSPGELLGQSLWEAFPNPVGAVFESEFRRCVAEQVATTFEEYYPLPLNKWFSVHAYPLDDGLSVYFTDVTERRAADEALRRYANRLESLRAIDLAIVSAHSPQEITGEALSHLAKLMPCRVGFAVLHHPDSNTGFEVLSRIGAAIEIGPSEARSLPELTGYEALRELRKGRVVVVGDVLDASSTGSMVASLTASGLRSYILSPLMDRSELIGLLILGADVPDAYASDAAAVVREVSDHLAIALRQAVLRDEVIAAKSRLEMLSRRLILAEEQERRRIARELHDETGQGLMALKINIRSVMKNPAAPTAAPRLVECLGLVDRTIAQVRNLSTDLRPSLLDDFGLTVALQSYCEALALRLGIVVEFLADPTIDRCDTDVETACYRIVQESLNNVGKHAGAQEVRVKLERFGDVLTLEVKDDGSGFDVAAARVRAGRGSSLGVLSMQERAALVGGSLTIESSDKRGTTVRSSLPYRAINSR